MKYNMKHCYVKNIKPHIETITTTENPNIILNILKKKKTNTYVYMKMC